MVGFLSSSSVEEEKEEPKNESLSLVENKKPQNDHIDFPLPELEDFSLSFDESILDFESIRSWIEEDTEVPDMDVLGVENNDFGVDKGVKMGSDDSVVKVNVEDEHSVKNEAVNAESLGQEKGEFGVVAKAFEMGNDQFCEKVIVEEDEAVKLESLGGLLQENGGSEVVVEGLGMGNDGFVEENEVEEGRIGGVCDKFRENRCSIEEVLEKVSLNGVSNGSNSVGAGSSGVPNVGVVGGEGNDGTGSGGAENSDGARKNEVVLSDEDESESDSESESESSSSSSSSSDTSSDKDEKEDQEEKGGARGRKEKVGPAIEMEEGEILAPEADEMISWSDDEDDEDAAKGPIKSKNELMVLPHVPPVDATLLPHHQTLPVGVVSSIIGAQVIVEGVERHNPLSEGSILWITESRSPLGLVDEIFGPVKNPYYIVRYNSESEVPTEIQQGTLISFVLEFANHVLNNPSLYKKGYDASNENDEELSDDAEFSDDEKEAEYRRMQKEKKRGTNDEKMENKKKNKKKSKNRFGAGKRNEAVGEQAALPDKPPVHQNQQFVQPAEVSSSCFDTRQIFANGPASSHLFPQLGQVPGFNTPPSSCAWSNGMPWQQTSGMGLPSGMPMQGMGLPSGMPMQGMQWPQQNHPQQVFQTPFTNGVPGVPFPQQMNMSSMLPSNLQFPGGQSYFGGRPPFSPWPAGPPQNVLNQPPFGINNGIQGQNAPTFINGGENAVPFNGSQALQPPNNSSGANDASRNFSGGRNFGGGRKSQRRGGGRFGGGRGRHQRN